MNSPEHFEVLADYACYRPFGQVSSEQAALAAIKVIAHCHEQGLPRLFVDMRNLSRQDRFKTLGTYELAKQAAIAADYRVRVALVSDRPISEIARFGITVSRNNGFIAEVFETEDQALAWLLDTKAR